MMLDAMAERYGMLPSAVLKEGNTLDLLVFDASSTYRRYLQDKSQGKPTIKTEDFSQEELKSMMEESRIGRKNKHKASRTTVL